MMHIPVTFMADEKGYFDRECPNEKCLYVFKISMEDWKEKVSDDEVHCPRCGYVDIADRWWTQGQLDGIKEKSASNMYNSIQESKKRPFSFLCRST